jgi:hypothetical protein
MAAFDTFRRTRQEMKKRAPKKTKGSTWSRENFQMAIDEPPALVWVLRPPPNSPFHIVRGHWLNGLQSCTCDLPGFEGKCLYCYANAKEKDKEPYPIRSNNVIELVDFRYFHAVSEEDDDGNNKVVFKRCLYDEPQPQKKRGTGACRLCESTDPIVRERHFGGHKKWEIYGKTWTAFQSAHFQLGNTCLHQTKSAQGIELCLKNVYLIGAKCGHCETEWLSEKDVQQLDPKELNKFLDEEHQCEKCQEVGPPVLVQICETEAHDVCPATIFDKPVLVTCAGEEKGTGKNKKVTRVHTFDPSAFDFDNLESWLENYQLDDEQIAACLTPWDMTDKYRPEFIDPNKEEFKNDRNAYVSAVLDAQARRSKRENPYKGLAGGGAPRSRPFQGRRQFVRGGGTGGQEPNS